MRSKVQEKSKAVKLRKQGKSYREILTEVKVSKGTLSMWLSNLDLSKKEEQYLVDRSKILQDNGRLKVALQNRERNELRREKIRKKARESFLEHCNDPFFVLGLALYWAEGAKKNTYFSFINSDPEMIKVMLQWVPKYLGVEPTEYKFRLYIHKPYAHENCERYWSRECAIPSSQFQQTIYKPTPHTVKKNPEYKGCLRMLFGGIDHLITIKAWQKLLSEYYVGSR